MAKKKKKNDYSKNGQFGNGTGNVGVGSESVPAAPIEGGGGQFGNGTGNVGVLSESVPAPPLDGGGSFARQPDQAPLQPQPQQGGGGFSIGSQVEEQIGRDMESYRQQGIDKNRQTFNEWFEEGEGIVDQGQTERTFKKQEKANERAESARQRMIERIKRSPPERRQRMIDNFNKRWSGERSPVMARGDDGSLVVGNAYISSGDVAEAEPSMVGGRGQQLSMPSRQGMDPRTVRSGTQVSTPEGDFRVQTKDGKKFNVPIIRDPKTGVAMPDPDSFSSAEEFLEYRTPEDARNISQAIRQSGGAMSSRLQEIDRAREGIRRSRAPMDAKRKALVRLEQEESSLQYEFLNRQMDGQAWGGTARSEPVTRGQVEARVQQVMQGMDPAQRAKLMRDPDRLRMLYQQVAGDLDTAGEVFDPAGMTDPTGRFGYIPDADQVGPSGVEVRQAVVKAYSQLSPEQQREIQSDPQKREAFERQVYDLMAGGEYVPGQTDIGMLQDPMAEEEEDPYVVTNQMVDRVADEQYGSWLATEEGEGASTQEKAQKLDEFRQIAAERLRVARDPFFEEEQPAPPPEDVGPSEEEYMESMVPGGPNEDDYVESIMSGEGEAEADAEAEAKAEVEKAGPVKRSSFADNKKGQEDYAAAKIEEMEQADRKEALSQLPPGVKEPVDKRSKEMDSNMKISRGRWSKMKDAKPEEILEELRFVIRSMSDIEGAAAFNSPKQFRSIPKLMKQLQENEDLVGGAITDEMIEMMAKWSRKEAAKISPKARRPVTPGVTPIGR